MIRKTVLGLATALVVGLLAASSFAQSVTMRVTNQFGSDVMELDNTCLSVKCPAIPSPLPNGITSDAFTAEPASKDIAMLQVTYGTVTGSQEVYACQFRAGTAKAAADIGGCLAPIVHADVYSGNPGKKKQASSPQCSIVDVQQDMDTCNLSVTFEIRR